MTDLVSERQKQREARTWPELDAFVTPLAGALRAYLADNLPGRDPQISKAHRELLRAAPEADLARAIVLEVIGALWLAPKKVRGKPRPVSLLRLAQRIGMQAFRTAVRAQRPEIGRLADAAIELDDRLTLGTMTRAGLYLLHALHVEVPGLVERYKRWRKRKFTKGKLKGQTRPVFVYHVRLNAAKMQELGAQTFVRALAHRPMLELPRRWEASHWGGYLYHLKDTVPLVENVPATAADSFDCPQTVYDALNLLQETPWKINEDVLEVAQAFRDDLLGLGQARRTQRQRAQEQALHRTLDEAREDAKECELYFVHNLDYRGRVYAVGSHLTTYGPDLARALLSFAEGADVTRYNRDDVVQALDRYGKGCLGRRLNLDEVTLVGQDRLGTRERWATAKKPWQYLAYCIERARLAQALAPDPHADGVLFRTTLPVWQDAHANGLQHYAALLGDAKLAKAVRLTRLRAGAALPDVYRLLARQMTASLNRLRAEDPVAERLWRRCGETIDRSLAKLPVTAFMYGGKDAGYGKFLKKLQEEDKQTKGWQDKETWKKEEAEREQLAVRFAEVAKTVLNGYGLLQGASDLQRSLYNAGLLIAGKGAPPHWFVPGTGFHVVARRDVKDRGKMRLSIVWDGKMCRLWTRAQRKRVLDDKAQARRLSPHLIHSLDAAHLMLVVTRFAQTGRPSIGTVHDNFATQAVHARSLATWFAACFWLIYGNAQDPLADLWRQFQDQCPELPDLPPRGPWRLDEKQFTALFAGQPVG